MQQRLDSRQLSIRMLIGGCAVGLSISWNIADTGPVATLLARHYRTSLAVIGLLPAILFAAELLAMLPGGRAIDRYGPKQVGLAAICISLIANLLLLAFPGTAAALALRFLAGFGVGLGFLAGAIYSQSAGHGEGTLASGIYGGASLGGGGLALALVPALVGGFGWRAPYVGGALVAALAALVVVVSPVAPPVSNRGQVPRFLTLMRDRTLARLGTLSAVSFGFSVILGNWTVTLLQRAGGYGRPSAAAIGSLILLLGVLSRPAGSVLTRALAGNAWRAVAASLLLGALGTGLLAASAGSALDILGAAAIGLAAGFPFGATLNGAARAYPAASGSAVGAMNTYAILAIVCGAPLVGLTFDLPGAGRIGFIALAALWASAIAVIPWELRLDG